MGCNGKFLLRDAVLTNEIWFGSGWVMAKGFIKTEKQKEATRLHASPATFILLSGGSRSGKTFINVRDIIVRALKAPNSRHLIARKRFNHVKQSIYYDTLQKVLKICFPNLVKDVDYVENKSDWFIKFSNGSEIWLAGLDNGERLEKILGNEYCTIYINEVSEIGWESVEMVKSRLAQKVMFMNKNGEEEELSLKMYFDCNPPSKRHWTYIVFVLGKNPIDKQPLPDAADYVWLRMNPDDNKQNIAKTYLTVLESMSAKSRKRFKDGDWTDDDEKALWKTELLDATRMSKADLPELKKLVVAIDPAGTSNASSDDTGIIVVGQDYSGHGWVLEDATGKMKPNEWAKKAIALYERWSADCIVGEVNFGGEMVENTIRSVDKGVPFKQVRATRGKALRADPIVALYEQGLIHHVGVLAALEDEMVTWTPESDWSPNRIDAMVWGFTFLWFGSKISDEQIYFC